MNSSVGMTARYLSAVLGMGLASAVAAQGTESAVLEPASAEAAPASSSASAEAAPESTPAEAAPEAVPGEAPPEAASGDAPPATATEDTAPATPQAEEIVVTATRREEKLQDVPISITVFNQEALDKRNVVSGSDLATYTPSLSVNNRFGPDQASFSIRGFSQELRTTASVGVYFAEVVSPRGGGNITAGDGAGPGAYFDLQNVQVLKGPQGTLFGRNTTGGAVLLVPRKPTNKLEGYLEGSAGDYGMNRAQGVLNLPINDWARMRFGLDFQDRDGYLDNVSGVGPDHLADVHYVAGRGSLVLDLSDALENYTIVSFADSDNHGAISGMFACNTIRLGPFCSAQLAGEDDDFYTVASPARESFNKLTQWQAINTTTWTVSDHLTAKNILSYADLEQTTHTSVFGTDFVVPAPVPGIGGKHFPFTDSGQVPGIPTNSQTSLVEEIQLQGKALDNRLVWQTGFYYENSKPDGVSGSQSNTLLNCDEDPGTDPATFRCLDVIRQLTIVSTGGAVDPGPQGSVSRQLGKVEYENMAPYAQATYSLTETLRLTGGLRYTWDDTHGTANQIVYTAFPTDEAGAPEVTRCINTTVALPGCRLALSQDSDALTWLIGLDYSPTDDVMTYAKYTRGYRQGSVNLFGAEGFQTHDPEHVDAYEIGAKTKFVRVVPGTFNIALFYNDLKDQQIQTGFQSSTGGAPPTTGILNAGKAEIAGIEVESTLWLLDDWSLDLSYTYLDTEIKSLDVPPAEPGAIYDIRVATSIEGDPMPQSPKHKLAASTTYRLPISDAWGRLYAGATWVYTAKQQTASSDDEFGTLDAYDLLNLNLNWNGVARSAFDLSLFMTNVTDEKYENFVPGLYDSLGAEFRMVGEPRMWGARVRYHFGV